MSTGFEFLGFHCGVAEVFVLAGSFIPGVPRRRCDLETLQTNYLVTKRPVPEE